MIEWYDGLDLWVSAINTATILVETFGEAIEFIETEWGYYN